MYQVYYFFTTTCGFDDELLEREIKKVYQNISFKQTNSTHWVIKLTIPKEEYNLDWDDHYTDYNIGRFIRQYCSSNGIDSIERCSC